MKIGPKRLIMMRHAISESNKLCLDLKVDPLYLQFKAEFERDISSHVTRKLAEELYKRYRNVLPDKEAPLAPGQEETLFGLGAKLYHFFMQDGCPDVVIISPYLRARQTFQLLLKGCPVFNSLPLIEDDEVREQDHGDVNRFLSWKIFGALYPELYRSFLENGHYNFSCPGGESTEHMRHKRVRPFLSQVREKYSGKRIFCISHALFITMTKNDVAGTGGEGFNLDFKAKKPSNCSLTCFKSSASSVHQSGLVVTDFDLIL